MSARRDNDSNVPAPPPAGKGGPGARARRRRAALVVASAVAVAGVAALIAVSASRTTSSPSTSARSLGGAGGGSGQVGERLPGFAIATIAGGSMRVPSGRPGAVFLTTATCESCIPSSKALDVLKRRFGARADVLWVSINPADTVASVRAFQRLVGHPAYSAALDSSGALARTFRVTVLGTAVVYDRRGRIVFRGDEPQLPALRSAFAKAGMT